VNGVTTEIFLRRFVSVKMFDIAMRNVWKKIRNSILISAVLRQMIN
jgi:hypothetical protein